jgi:hypothetical protein
LNPQLICQCHNAEIYKKKSPNIGQFAHCEIGVALSQKNTGIKLDKIILTEVKKGIYRTTGKKRITVK